MAAYETKKATILVTCTTDTQVKGITNLVCCIAERIERVTALNKKVLQKNTIA